MSCRAVVPQSLIVLLFSSIHLINTGFLTPAWCISLMTWKKRKIRLPSFLMTRVSTFRTFISSLINTWTNLMEKNARWGHSHAVGKRKYRTNLVHCIPEHCDQENRTICTIRRPVGSLTDVEKFCAWCGNQFGVFSNFYFTLSSPVGSWMSSWSIMYSAKDFILCPKEVLLVCEHKLKGLFINVLLQRSLICSIESQKEAH